MLNRFFSHPFVEFLLYANYLKIVCYYIGLIWGDTIKEMILLMPLGTS